MSTAEEDARRRRKDELRVRVDALPYGLPHLVSGFHFNPSVAIFCGSGKELVNLKPGALYAVIDPQLAGCEKCLALWDAAKVEADEFKIARERARALERELEERLARGPLIP